MKSKRSNNGDATRGYEISDANSRAILLSGLIILAVLIASLVMLTYIFRWRVGSGKTISFGSAQHVADNTTPEHISINDVWKRIDEETATRLEQYRWINADEGVVQIPIERAMEIVAQPSEPP